MQDESNPKETYHWPAQYRGEIPPDRRAEALSLLVAVRADRVVDLVKFRRAHLADGLLEPEEVKAWLGRQPGGHPGVVLELPDWAQVDSRVNHPEPDLWVATIRLAAHGILGELRTVTEAVGQEIGFGSLDRVSDPTYAELVRLVLTGRLRLPLGSATGSARPALPGLTTINLEVSPRMRHQDLLALFDDARKAMGTGGRDVREEWRAALAVFVERVNDGRTWRAAMDAWNAEHPDMKQYDDWRRFSADCRDSYSRITGEQIDWKPDLAAEVDELKRAVANLPKRPSKT